MGYFKARAREPFVAPNEKNRLREVQSQARIVSAAWFE